MGWREYQLLMKAGRALNAQCSAIFDDRVESPRKYVIETTGWSIKEIRELSRELWTLAAKLEHLELGEG